MSFEFFQITAAYLSVLWQAHPVQSCAGGRYGRYENWPSNNDWDELLMLITGKYGKNGWGWHQQNSYAYSSLGDYPSGALKYSSSPFDTSGSGLQSTDNSNGITSGYSGNQYHSGGISGGGGGGSGAISKLNTDKIREALNSFFKTKKKAKPAKPSSGWSSGGGGGSSLGSGGSGGGFVGESFIDSPGPGPPYASHDDSPIVPGPPYQDNIGPGPPYESSWSEGGGSGPGPSSSPFSGGPPSGVHDHQSSWPTQQEGPPPPPSDHSSLGSPHSSYNDQSSNQLYNNEHRGSSNGGGGGGSQFQSDFETFGGSQGDYKKKRRRQGRRHPFSNSAEQPQPSKQRQTHYRRVPQKTKAGLPTRPVLMGVESNGRRPFKFPPFPGSSGGEGGGGGGARRGISRRNRRMGAPMALRRRMFNTKFGGYKVDFSRLRFG